MYAPRAINENDMEDSMKKPIGVTKDILEEFLAKAGDEGVSSDIIAALRKALVEDGKSSEKAILEAIFPESRS